MFESLVANLLDKYLSVYVTNFDKNQLNLSIWSGDVELKGLEIKGSAFDAFNLPISVLKGSIGHFKLKIPWKNLGSSSVVVEISDVYLLVRPKKDCTWDEKEEIEKQNKLKQHKLEAFELLKTEKKKSEENKKGESKNDPGFMEKLTETIINNLQVKIENVHCRYEDVTNVQLTLQQGNLSFKEPKAFASVLFEEVKVHLDDKQYRNLLNIIEYMTNFDQLEEYRLFKPISKLTEKTAKQHWEYVVEVSKRDTMKKYFSWKGIMERRKNRIDYIELYKRKQEVPWLEKLEGESLEKFTKIENQLTYEDIILFRGLSQAEIDLEISKNKEYVSYIQKKQQKAQAWFSWGGDDENEAPAVMKISEDQRKLLYKEIGYTQTEEIQSLKYPDDYVKFGVHVKLKTGSICLNDSKTQNEIIDGILSVLDVDVGLKDKSTKVSVSLNDFSILDKYTKNTFFPEIISRGKSTETITSKERKKLINVDFEYMPPSKKSDIFMGVELNRTDIILNVGLIQKILGFFVIPPELNLENLQTQAVQQFTKIQQQAQTQLQLAIEQKKSIDLSLKIEAPTFIIPHQCENENSRLLILDLGKLQINSDLNIEERSKRILDKKTIESDYYDNYKLKMDEIQVVMSRLSEWKSGKIESKLENQLLEKVTFDLEFGQCITPENVNLTKTKINAKMSKVIFNLSSPKIALILKILNNFLKLADNPTGVSANKLILESYVNIQIPNNEWKRYWVELREGLGILLYKSQSDIHPSGRINVSSEKLTIQTVQIEKEENAFEIILPQGDSEDKIFFFGFNDQFEKEKWRKAVTDLVLSYTSSLMLAGKKSIDLENEKKIEQENEEAQSATQNKFIANFILEEFSVFLNDQDSESIGKEIPLCGLVFNKLNIDFVLRNFDMAVNMSLVSLDIKDLCNNAKDKFILTSSHSNENNALVNLSLVRALTEKSDKYSPNAESVMKLKLNDVDIYFDPYTLSIIVKMLFDLIEVFRKLESRQNYYSVNDKSSTGKIAIGDQVRSSFQLFAVMDSMKLTLVDYGSIFASASLKAAQLELLIGSKKINVVGDLGDLVVFDHDPETLYKEILGLKNKQSSLVQFEYNQNLQSSNIKDPIYTKLLKIKFNSVKAVYLNRLIRKSSVYFGSGPLMDALSEGTKRLAKKAYEVVVAQSNSIEMFQIDLEFIEPLIIVPAGYKSSDKIIGNLGQITVKNILEKVTERKEEGTGRIIKFKSTNWIENYVVSLNNMNLKTKISQKETNVLNNTNIIMEIRRSVVNPNKEILAMHFSMEISQVSIILSQIQYQFIFRFLEGNINDTAGVETNTNTTTQIKQTSEDVVGTLENKSTVKEEIEEETAIKISSLFQIHFPKVNLTLLRGKGVNKLGQENPIAQLNMVDFKFLWKTRNDGSTEGAINLLGISAFDKRIEANELNVFNEFIKTGKSSEKSQNFIDFSFSTYKNGDKVLNLDLGTPRIVFVPEVVVEIKNFFADTQTKQKQRVIDRFKKENSSTAPTMTGDLHLSTNTWLGEDIHLTTDRKLYIDKNDSGMVTLDGSGFKMIFHRSKNETFQTQPLVYIAHGMTLKVQNLKIEYFGSLEKAVSYGTNSKLIAPATLGVTRTKLDDSSETPMPTIQKTDEEIEREASSSRLSFSGTFGNPQILFPEKSTDKDSKILVVQLSVDMFYNQTNNQKDASLNLNNVTVFVEHEDHDPENSAPIVEPVQITADMHSQIIDHLDSMIVKVNVGNEVISRISYQDVKMITTIAQSYNKKDSKLIKRKKSVKVEEEEEEDIISGSTTDDDDDEFKDIESDEDEDDDEFKDIEDDEIDEDDVEVNNQKSDTLTEDSNNRYDIFFNSDNLSILVVDDIQGLDRPLIDFQLVKCFINASILKSKTTTISASLNFEVFSDYYNLRHATWEPILEHWGCSLSFGQKPTNDPHVPSCYEVSVQPLRKKTKSDSDHNKTKNPLLINVTKTMLDTITTTATLWKEGLTGKYAVSKKFLPYLIKNQSGMDLKFSKMETKDKMVTLKTGEEYGFNFHFKRSEKQNTMILLQIDELESQTIDIQKVTKFVLCDDKKEIVIFIEIELIDGKKIINVRSGLRIHNTTSITWTVGVTHDGDNYIDIGDVKPDDHIAIPIQHILKGSLAVKPTDFKIYGYSPYGPGVLFVELMKLNSGGFRLIESRSTNPREPALAFYVVIKVSSGKTINPEKRIELNQNPYLFQKYDYTIQLRTPMAFENLLGCPLEYEIYDKRTWESKSMKVADGKLDRGERISLYTTNLKNIMLLKCKLPGSWKIINMAVIYTSSQKSDKPLSTSLPLFEEDDVDKNQNKIDLLFDYGYNSEYAFREVLVYVTHWIINRTNLKFTIKDNMSLVAGQNQKEKKNDPLMFTFKQNSNAKKISVSVEKSEFSNQFSIDNVGTDGNLTLKSEKNRFDIGYTISLAPGKFNRTKIVTFSSRIVLVNKTEEIITFAQFESESLLNYTLKPTERVDFYWPDLKSQDPKLCLKIEQENQSKSKFSNPFAINSLGEIPIKLSNIIISIQVLFENGSIFVVVLSPEKPPYLIDNKTDEDVKIYQINVPNKSMKVQKQTQQEYCWEDNLGPHTIVVSILNHTIQMELDKVTKEKKLPIDNEKKLYVSVLAKGPTKVLRISANPKEDTFNEKDSIETYLFFISAFLDGIGISLIDNTPILPQELAFLYVEDLDLKLSQTEKRRYFDVKVERLEIDNQSNHALFDVLFSSSRKQENKEFIHLSVSQSLEETSIYYVPYFSFAMQEAVIQIDYVFINEFLNYIDNLITSSDEEDKKAVQKVLDSIVEPSIEPTNSKKFYFSLLELHPIKAIVTFKYNKPKGEEISNNPVMLVLDTLGVTLLANIDEAALCLNPLILSDPFETKDSLIQKIKTHYTRSVTTEFYKILGSLDVIGNPVGLFNDLTTGVKDFFYEPAKAIYLVQEPEDVTKGIKKGTISLFTNSLHGTFNTASKVTGSIGQGLSFLTFDENYIREHQKQSTSKPNDIRQGLLDGSEAFAKSIYEGATGLFTKPIEGAKEEGAFGLLKGFGKGLIGIPVKPVAGLFDFATKTTEGISNVRNYFDTEHRGRVRLPRTFSKEGLLIPYSPADSYAQYLLSNISNGMFQNQKTLYLFENEKETIILLTNQSLICVKKATISLEWRIDIHTIRHYTREKDGAILVIYPQTSYKDGSRRVYNQNPHKMETFCSKLDVEMEKWSLRKSQKVMK